MSKSYSGMAKLETYGDRLRYLHIGDNNVPSPRSISHPFYKSTLWQHLRHDCILRDSASDLGIQGLFIPSHIIVHHINPLTLEDLEYLSEKCYDMDNLVCVSPETHNMIHYRKTFNDPVERQPGDTKLW